MCPRNEVQKKIAYDADRRIHSRQSFLILKLIMSVFVTFGEKISPSSFLVVIFVWVSLPLGWKSSDSSHIVDNI